MGKLGDLWVRLGLKKTDFDKGMKDAEKRTSSFGSVMSKVAKGGALAIGGIAIAVKGVIGVVKELTKQNQTLGDAWGRTTAGMTAMWDTLKTSVANMDFSHILSSLSEAGRLARELYDAMDALGEVQTGYNMRVADNLSKLNQLRIDSQDQTKTLEERIKAGEDLIALQKDLEKDMTRALSDVNRATLNDMANRLGIVVKGATEEQLEEARDKVIAFYEWLQTYEGQQYNDAAKIAAKKGKNSAEAINFATNAAYRGKGEFAAMAVAYNKNVNDDKRVRMEGAYVAYRNQENKVESDLRRTINLVNSLKASQNKAGSAISDAADRNREQAEKMLEDYRQAALSEEQRRTEKFERDMAEALKYGLDTSLIEESYFKDIGEIINRGIEDINMEIEDNPIDFEAMLGDVDAASEQMQAFIDDFEEGVQKAQALKDEFIASVVGGLSDGFQELADQFMGLQDVNAGAVVQALLTPLADMAVRQGEIVMAAGLGVEAVREALGTLQGPPAIAAGAALIAIGAAAKSGLAALAKSGSATTVADYGGMAGGSTGEVIRSEMVVRVEGTLKGNNIVLSGKNTVEQWNR